MPICIMGNHWLLFHVKTNYYIVYGRRQIYNKNGRGPSINLSGTPALIVKALEALEAWASEAWKANSNHKDVKISAVA